LDFARANPLLLERSKETLTIDVMTQSEKWIEKGFRFAYFPREKDLQHAFNFRFVETNVEKIKEKLKNPLLQGKEYVILDLKTNEKVWVS